MIETSTEFKTAMNSQTIIPKGKVIIDFSGANTQDQSIIATSNGESRVSRIEQVYDGIFKTTANYIGLDGSWVLDGNWVIAPETDQEARYNQIGWWSDSVSLDDHSFAVNPILAVEFSLRAITNIRICFDSKRLEYATSFEICLLDDEDTELWCEEITDNNLIQWYKSLDSTIFNVKKMTLEIKSWSVVGRTAKVVEMFTSIQETFYSDDIISIKVTEERQADNPSRIEGNISSNECSIRLDNFDDKFSFGNTESRLNGLVLPGRRFRSYIGLELPNGSIEYVPMGVFWCKNWIVPDMEKYAETVGNDMLDLLSGSMYETSKVTIPETPSTITDNDNTEWNNAINTNILVSENRLNFGIVRLS